METTHIVTWKGMMFAVRGWRPGDKDRPSEITDLVGFLADLEHIKKCDPDDNHEK